MSANSTAAVAAPLRPSESLDVAKMSLARNLVVSETVMGVILTIVQIILLSTSRNPAGEPEKRRKHHNMSAIIGFVSLMVLVHSSFTSRNQARNLRELDPLASTQTMTTCMLLSDLSAMANMVMLLISAWR